MEQTRALAHLSVQAHCLDASDSSGFLAAQGRAEALPACWHPFGPPALGAWVGPNGAVAKADKRGKLTLCDAGEARSLLVEHGFRSTLALDRAACSIDPALSLGQVAGRIGDILPGFRPVESDPATELHLVRMTEPVIRLHGKYGQAEWAEIIEGEAALDYVLTNVPDAAKAIPRDTLTLATDAPEGKRVLRVIVYALAVLLLSPIIVAPILLFDAVLWLIAIGVVWIAAVFFAERILMRWEKRNPRPLIRLDPWRVWLPVVLGGHVLDRGQLDVWLDWIKPFGTASTGQAGIAAASVRNPARTCLNLKLSDLHIVLSHIHEPPPNANLPLKDRGEVPDELHGMAREDLWKLAAALAPEIRRTRSLRQQQDAQEVGSA